MKARSMLGGAGLIAGWGMVAALGYASEVNLTVSLPSEAAEGGVAQNHLSLGVESGATDSFDTPWDAVAAFPSDVLTAVIRHPSYPTGRQSLWWDVRGDTFPQVWDIKVTSDQADASISLSWTPPSTVAAQCAQVAWTLQDALTGQTYDLAASPSPYSFTNQAGTPRLFIVTASSMPTATPPPPPFNLWSPRQGRASVYLAWSGPRDPGLRYHLYREDDRGRVRVTTSPQGATSYVDTGLDAKVAMTYRVTAVDARGCESPYSAETVIAPRR